MNENLIYELPSGDGWRARLIRWFRKTFKRPRYYVAVDYGNKYDDTVWVKARVYIDGAVAFIEDGSFPGTDQNPPLPKK